MNFKKNLFVLTLVAAFCAPIFANTTVDIKKEPTKTVSKEIKTMIQKIDLNFEKLQGETIKLKFMVNENNELIVIGTEESQIDKTLKAALNYKKIDSKELVPYSLYIVPIKFNVT